MHRPDLTAEEKTKPYSKYYYMELAKLPQETRRQIEAGPIEPAKALAIHNRNDLLKPGYLEKEVGYCVMPDGSGYVAMFTKLPGVTKEMIHWWFVWHPLEDLRYKIWHPDDHFSITVDKPERLLSSTLSYEERDWGTTHYPVENIGSGTQELAITFMSPEQYGFDMTLWHEPNVAICRCANISVSNKETLFPLGALAHFYRSVAGGLELRSRFWLGYHIVDKKPVRLNNVISLETVKALTSHCAYEYNNLASFLPQLYKEQHQ